jgi:ribonuclease HII
MQRLGLCYPAYGFERHMGYGVPEHAEALRRHGATPFHRRSFKPIADVLRASEAGVDAIAPPSDAARWLLELE